ncbi:hypothetical protein SPV1_07259 [Mariprofundus ferrooxydans PV-1]|uniref:Uncharacterized protein n=1 Tax=Mariprofundus ferrooxydans PV-1 TaxID=314345 RepID=Q0F0A5_9PROT|nr:hypothetical protein SPV1_07259 [Mariprofundus ferrooxydans PV-1]
MHYETFIPVFLLFTVLGLIMPLVFAGVADKHRNG